MANTFFNNADELVAKALHGFAWSNPSVVLDAPNKIISRRLPCNDNNNPKVSIVSGGGSGHEPGFAGFVGPGLLTAAVAGTVFASPSAEQVRRAIMERVPHEKGVLVLTMQYTGDKLNFGIAAEKAKASGIPTELIAIGDDVSVGRAKGAKVGRRGIAGVVLVLKILGALAEKGASLTEVHSLAKLLFQNIMSIAASLQHVHVPGRRQDGSERLDVGQVELGMGIHNEPGSQRANFELSELVERMLAQLLDKSDADRNYVEVDAIEESILLINNLGGLSQLELLGITDEVCLQLEQRYDIIPSRILSGTYLTSLNGLGFSITLLKVVSTGLGNEISMLNLLDEPAQAVGWPSCSFGAIKQGSQDAPQVKRIDSLFNGTSTGSKLLLDLNTASTTLRAGLEAVIAAEPEVTRFDTIVGDGDCGTGLKRGADALLAELSTMTVPPNDAAAFVRRLIPTIENNMDGTSGAIITIFTHALVAGLQEQESGVSTPDTWAHALRHALRSLSRYTPAGKGDRTMMDSIIPFVEVLTDTRDLHRAAAASAEGAESTKSMQASLGRTVYVGNSDKNGLERSRIQALGEFRDCSMVWPKLRSSSYLNVCPFCRPMSQL